MVMEYTDDKRSAAEAGRGSRGQNASSRASSRASSTASSQDTLVSQPPGTHSMDLTAFTGGYDMRAHLRQILTFSDDEETAGSLEEDDVSLESYDEADDDQLDDELQRLIAPQTHTPKPTDQAHAQALVPITEEGDVDSEEEREILREIRDEITNNVRHEMKSELDLYKAKMDNLQTGSSAGGEQGERKADQHADLQDLEPKLRAAIIKMRKLDKILVKRISREKQVKRDRILLERRIRREIEGLHKEGKEEYKEVTTNEQKFLALELPSRHNEGVTVPDEFTGEEVFATQLNEEEYPGLHTHQGPNKNKGKVGSDGRDVGEGDSQTDDGQSRAGSSSTASGSLHGKKHRQGKDFIKRNKQLAADAGNVIAMTEEEKQRLDDLLLDVEAIPDIPDAPGMLDDSNPFQIAVKPGEGFVPGGDELRTLTSIDSRLKDLMPPEDYESIASSTLSHAPKHQLFTHTGVKHADDWQRRGDRALFQNAEQRELNDRMLAIEMELAKLKNPDEAELEPGRLGEDQLHDLIEQCVTSLSRSSMSRLTLKSDSRTSFLDAESINSQATTIDNTPRSPRSARQEMLENPPRLPPDVLQKLLSEAYHPLSKHLSTLTENEHEDEESTPVPADVWKLIAMEKVGENGVAGEATQVNNEPTSARNGFPPFSRTSTSSSLASVSDIGRDSRESQVVKLPEIDPSGTLITQGHYNQQSVSSQRPDSSNSVRSQWCVSSQHLDSSNLKTNHHSVKPDQHSDNPNYSWTPVNNMHNSRSDSRLSDSHSDSRLEIMSIDGDLMSPHPPPPKDKREAISSAKSRTLTPASKANVT